MTIENRKYKNYDKYLSHQSKKLDIGIKKKINNINNGYKSIANSINPFSWMGNRNQQSKQ